MFNPRFKGGQLFKKNKKIVWRGLTGAEEYGKNTHLRILCRRHTPFQICRVSSKLVQCHRVLNAQGVQLNTTYFFFHEFVAKGCVSPLNWDDRLRAAHNESLPGLTWSEAVEVNYALLSYYIPCFVLVLCNTVI